MTPRERFDALEPSTQAIFRAEAEKAGIQPWEVFDVADRMKAATDARRAIMEHIASEPGRSMSYVANLFGITRQALHVTLKPGLRYARRKRKRD